MKKFLPLAICFFSLINNSFCQVKRLELRDKVVNLSSLTKNGKVTVFLFSIYGCAPCLRVEEELNKKYSSNKNFELYHCSLGNMQDVYNWKTYKNTPVATYWSQVERIYQFPTLYIYGPAGNLNYKYSEIDNGPLLEEITGKIDYLLNNLDYFNKLTDREKPGHPTTPPPAIQTTLDTVLIQDTAVVQMDSIDLAYKRAIAELEKKLSDRILVSELADVVAIILSLLAIKKSYK